MSLEHLETLIAFAVVMLGVSLLITVLTQMVSALLGLRGTNLLWGLRTLFSTIDRRLVNQAEAVLRHPLISDSAFSRFKDVPFVGRLVSRWTLASAVEPGEMVCALAKISEELKTKDPSASQVIDGLLEELDPEAERKIRMLGQALGTLAPNYGLEVDKIMQQITGAAQQSVGRLESMFNTVMGRVSQRFAVQMRVWTVVFAIVIAFAAHLDALRLLNQLSSNPEMRASLVASRDAMMREAGTIIALPSGSPQDAVPGVDPQVYAAGLTALVNKEPGTVSVGEVPPAFSSLDDAVKWLEPRLAGDENRKKELVAEYKMLVSAELMQRANSIRSRLESSGFQLIPVPYPWFHYDGLRNLLGILISAALLSLGAPFWFNALKSLSSLRPVLAAAQAKGQGTAA
jgi:hypothetical protein